MQLSNALSLATGAMALAVGSRSNDVVGSNGGQKSMSVQQKSSSWGGGGGDNPVTYPIAAHLRESLNKSVLYTIAHTDKGTCEKFVNESTKNCPGLEVIDACAEQGGKDLQPVDNVLAESSKFYGSQMGWLTSKGDTNKTISDCATKTFNQADGDFKNSGDYKIGEIYTGVALGILSFGVGVAALCATDCCSCLPTRSRRQNRSDDIALQPTVVRAE